MPTTAKQPDVHFDEATHTYTVAGQVVPSVTQVLKSAGVVDDRWFNDDARTRGTTVAIAIELHSKGELRSIPDGYRCYVDAWEKFLAETGFVPFEVEKVVYNGPLGYAGKLDAEGHIPGAARRLIIDVKTGCDVPHYPLQTAGYNLAEDGLHERWCVFLQPNGTYAIRQHTDPRDHDVFLAALKLVHWKREHLK